MFIGPGLTLLLKQHLLIRPELIKSPTLEPLLLTKQQMSAEVSSQVKLVELDFSMTLVVMRKEYSVLVLWFPGRSIR